MPEKIYDHEFWTEVGSTAHELGITYGGSAVSYAERKAERALAEGKPEEHRFWTAVAAANKLR